VSAIDELGKASEQAEKHEGAVRDHAQLYRDSVLPKMAQLRRCSDAVETVVDDALWPFPKYRELLFLQ